MEMAKYARLVLEIEIKETDNDESIFDQMSDCLANCDMDINDIEITNTPYQQANGG